jgi:hypothetical protein
MFAPVLDDRSPLPVEEALVSGTSQASPAPLPEAPDAGAQVRDENAQAKYSPIFKMGLFFSVPCLFPVLLSPISLSLAL